MKRFIAGILGALLLQTASAASLPEACAQLAKTNLPPAQKLHQLFALHWSYQMAENPESATWNGYPGHNHRWSDLSFQAIDRRKQEVSTPLAVIDSIDRSQLSVPDRLFLDLFKTNLLQSIESI